MSVYRFFGHVVDQTTHRGLAGLRVEAWDAEGHCPDLVAFAVTGARGEFTMSLDDEYLADLFQDRSPTLTFHVFTTGEVVQARATKYFLWKLANESTTGRIEVGAALPMGRRARASSVVRGSVRSATGEPQAGVEVKAFDRTLSTETPEVQLGATTSTDADGQYRITYTPTGGAGRITPDLVVRAYAADGSVLVESQRLCRAPATAIVNLVVGGVLRGPSEIDALQARIAAHQMDLVLREATADQQEHLACASGSGRAQVAALATAGALSNETGIPVPAHYALLREGLPSTRRELLRLPQRELRRALQNAVSKNTLSLPSGVTIDDVMAQIRSAAVDMAFEVPPGGTGSVGDLVTSVVGSRAVNFVDSYLAHEGTIEEFWEQIGTGTPTFSTAEITNLQLAFQFGALSRFHFPLIAELQDRKASSAIGSLRDLARYSEAEWVAVLEVVRNGQPIGFPSDTAGEDESGQPDPALQKVNYAKTLRRMMEEAYPAATIAGDIQRATPQGQTDSVVTFIDTHQDFDFGKTRVAHYLEKNGITFTDDTATRLRQVELLHKLTPRYTEMKVLMDAGLHSAREVVRKGRNAFIAAHATALGGVDVAEQIFANAQCTAARALAYQARFGAAMNQKTAFAVADIATVSSEAQAPEAADWATLFRSPDFCDCDHCNSVYGPAAYFVDLLEFLGKHESNVEQGGSTPTAKDVLLGKRKDLGRIDLSCDNTLVALPYVDLVNEILEHQVWAPAAAYPNHIATVGTTKDLRALPAAVEPNVRTAAYNTLAAASYPWSLPFDLGATEARVYLNHLGVPRHELMRSLQYLSANAPAGYDSLLVPRGEDIAAERLGLSRSERLSIVSSSLDDLVEIPGFWGIAGVTTESEVDSALSPLTNVPEFLKRSGLSYAELVDLLDTAFAKSFGDPHVFSATDPCDTSTMTIVGINASQKRAFFDTVHRFVRLAKRIGYSFRELDQAMTSPNSEATAIDDALLVKLAAIEGLRARFGLPVAVVASWFGPLEIHQRSNGTDAPYYNLVFQNRAVQNPPDEDLRSNTLSGTLGGHTAALLAALRMGAEDFALLTDTAVCQAQTGGAAPLAGSDTVTVNRLSELHRHVSFARALGLPLRDFLILKTLGGQDFDPFDPTKAEAFVAVVDRARRAGFTAADLAYLFADIAAPTAAIVPSSAAILATLDRLIAALVKLRKEKAEVADPMGDKLKSFLADTVANATQRANIWALLNSASPSEAAFDADMSALCWNPVSAKAKLAGAGVLTSTAERYSLALAEMSMKQEGERLIQQTLGAALQLDVRTVDVLLRTVLTAAPGGTTSSLLDIFKFRSEPVEVPDPRSLSTDRYDDQREAYKHLDKAATIVRRLGMTADEVLLLTKPGTAPAPMFDLDALPRAPGQPATTRFREWQTLVDVLAMRPALPGGSAGLLAVLEVLLGIPVAPDYDANEVANAISTSTGWPVTDVLELLTTGFRQHILPLTHSGEKIGELLLWLRDARAVIQRLGVSAATAIGWIVPVPPLFDAKPIIQAAKSKHSEDEWATIAPPLRDVIRDKQRNALVSYLMAERGYASADQLFSELYIDVQMSPCQLTSRIKQAIGSVQTFVQRALLHLEPATKLTEEAAREWSWRRSYRVWEANRKIFLYPENWIYPELRDDKSPFFKQLERDLRQKDITDDVAEDAFATYLESLEQVARLDVVAMFHQEEPSDGEHDAIDVLHVIGRTKLEPHKYFYRTRVDGSYWTPWEPIDLEIEGDHLVLSVINRRVHLFWPVIEKKPDTEQKMGTPTAAGAPTRKHLEIRLAWSRYHNKKWSARQVSKGDAITLSPSLDARRLTFVLAGPRTIVCLLNPGLWLPWHRELFTLGSFVIAACDSRASVYNEALSFVNPKTEVEDAVALFEKATQEADVDESQAAKTFEKAMKQAEKAANAPALLDEQLNSAQADEVTLTLPALFIRVYQDDKPIPANEVDKTMANAQYKKTLTLPLATTNGTPMFTVLGHASGSARVLAMHDIDVIKKKDRRNELEMFFYKDGSLTLFAELESATTSQWTSGSNAQPGVTDSSTDVEKHYRFWTFYHPYACDYIKALSRGGAGALLQWSQDPANRSIQFASNDVFSGTTQYAPNPQVVAQPYPSEDVDFSFFGAYASYNWEVFFHIPFLVATRLMQNQRFDEAQKWFHYIFDPTSGGTDKAPQRFWKVKPLFENLDLATIQHQLFLAAGGSTEAPSSATKAVKNLLQALDTLERQELDAQVAAWEKNPFNPHAVARLRPLAYQKAVVMKYIENLIAWGDQLFRRDTLESINEATQLYILASQLLGPRPVGVRRAETPAARTYAEIEGQDMGPFSDPLVAVESLVYKPSRTRAGTRCPGSFVGFEPPPDLKMLLFCVPQNEMLLGLWDTVADRLFKIRHCMNIEGVVRQLPLFEPPIDPALLVRAAAAGVDLSSALDDANPLLPHYRFSVMHGKAMELASGVAALGGAFLSALEKKDAEGLSRLRSGQEIDLLTAVREVKREQLREAQETLKGLQKALEVATIKRDYYHGLPKVSAGEAAALTSSGLAIALSGIAQGLSSGSAAAASYPTVTFGAAGWAGSPVTVSYQGGQVISRGLALAARTIGIAAEQARDHGTILATLAGYDRRWEEWKLQERLANKEIQQIEKQIAAAEIRVAVAEKEIENHERQMRHAQEVGDYLRDKLTNEELYDWMIEELSTVYFQSYKLAYDMAKRAEKAYRFERAVESSSYITFGYWDSLKKGLLAGERLQHDLRRLEVAYLEQNAREYEITKHVSLAALAPAKLMELRDTGSCTFTLDEKQFDLDYPGHYLRRIKSVSVTIPALNGPYTGVNCTLRLKNNSVRKSTKDAGTAAAYERNDGNGLDPRFAISYEPVTQTIVTSSAQNDGGLFELNFRDERYLPFEGAGAISTWDIRLPKATNGFDVSAVSDVILHVRYTARYGGDEFRDDVMKNVAKGTRAGKRLLSLRAEFPDAWAQFMSPGSGAPLQTLSFQIDASMLPYVFGWAKANVSGLSLYAVWQGGHRDPVSQEVVWYSQGGPLELTIKRDNVVVPPPPPPPADPPVDPPTKATLTAGLSEEGESNIGFAELDPPQLITGQWVIQAEASDIDKIKAELRTTDGGAVRLDDSLQDILLLVEYAQAVPTWA